jgi:hypothetical protein
MEIFGLAHAGLGGYSFLLSYCYFDFPDNSQSFRGTDCLDQTKGRSVTMIQWLTDYLQLSRPLPSACPPSLCNGLPPSQPSPEPKRNSNTEFFPRQKSFCNTLAVSKICVYTIPAALTNFRKSK